MLGRFLVCAIIWLSWVSSGATCARAGSSPPSRVAENYIVNEVRCGDWERTDRSAWIAQGSATIVLEEGGTVTLRRVLVTDPDSDLYETLEYFCRDDLDGGLDY